LPARLLLPLTLAVAAAAQQPRPVAPAFRSSFQQAYLSFQAGQFADAAARLEKLQVESPRNFDVHELLGLTYAAEKDNTKAVEELRVAARLSPASVSARNNLATSLIHAGRPDEAEAEWRAALAADPADYTANRNLARLYLQQARLQPAIPLLEKAQKIHPEALDNGYDLALAYEMQGQYTQAHDTAEALLRQKDASEFHALLGQIDEKQAKYVDAVNQFSTAAHLDPSEENLFIWASELMAHRAYEPAITVFEEGTRRYPQSPRLWVGQGMALYARGDYQESIDALLKATDLNAEDPRAYVFLSKAYLSSPSQAEAVIDRFRRYAALKPNDAQAQFDYGISLWKGRRVNTPEVDYPAVEALLRRSIALDPKNAEVYLQLGILLNDQHEYEQAEAEFERAVALDPTLADAHFRLGRAYLRAGEKQKSDTQLDQFRILQAQHQAVLDKERAEVQQFVMATQSAASKPPASHQTP
jgi:tetratricopeptide (TPR) repeat protein